MQNRVTDPRFLYKMEVKKETNKSPVQARVPKANIKALRVLLEEKGWNISEYVAFHIECLLEERRQNDKM